MVDDIEERLPNDNRVATLGFKFDDFGFDHVFGFRKTKAYS